MINIGIYYYFDKPHQIVRYNLINLFFYAACFTTRSDMGMFSKKHVFVPVKIGIGIL